MSNYGNYNNNTQAAYKVRKTMKITKTKKQFGLLLYSVVV